MSKRLDDYLATLSHKKASASKGLITFTMAGDPDLATSSWILNRLPEHGADIVEIGMPFSDPLADGPIIQDASTHALRQATTPERLLTMISSFRKRHPKVPLIVMGYANIMRYRGEEQYARELASSGADGVITSDLPPEEEQSWRKALEEHDLALIRMIAPTTPLERMAQILPHQKGFIYYVSVAGTTGTTKANPASVEHRLKQIRGYTSLPIAVGFGIQTPQDVRAMAPFADLVVVGSRLCDMVAQERNHSPQVIARSNKAEIVEGEEEKMFGALFSCVRSLKEAL